jgi:hypothetical protein
MHHALHRQPSKQLPPHVPQVASTYCQRPALQQHSTRLQRCDLHQTITMGRAEAHMTAVQCLQPAYANPRPGHWPLLPAD